MGGMTAGSEPDRFFPTRSRDRLWHHPNENHHNRLAYAIHESVYRYAAEHYASGTLIDIGCGRKPLEPIFRPYVGTHIGVDHAATPHGVAGVDIVATAYDVPLPDCSADTILMSAVLEHLERPGDALHECHRLLRRGDTRSLQHHSSGMFTRRRETSTATRPTVCVTSLRRQDSRSIEVRPFAGVWATLSLEISYAMSTHQRRRAGPLLAILARGLTRLLSIADRLDYQPGFSWAHLAVVRRPAKTA